MTFRRKCPRFSVNNNKNLIFANIMFLFGLVFFSDYPHAITIVSPCSGSDKKQVLNFCAQSAEELLKFVEDLKESISEVSEMEQIRIECE